MDFIVLHDTESVAMETLTLTTLFILKYSVVS